VCGIHVVSNEMKWSVFLCATLYLYICMLDINTRTTPCLKQELSYRQQIARQLRTEYAEGIYRHKYYTVTLKSR